MVCQALGEAREATYLRADPIAHNRKRTAKAMWMARWIMFSA